MEPKSETTNQRKLRLLTNQERITRNLINTLRRDQAKTRKKIVAASEQVSTEKPATTFCQCEFCMSLMTDRSVITNDRKY